MKQGVARTTRQVPRASLLLTLTTVFAFSCFNAGCVRRSHKVSVTTATNDAKQSNATAAKAETNSQSTSRTNINTASAEDLEKLPGIGKGLAARIIEHRKQYGPFRKPEHLIIVRGISDKRFRAVRELITVE